LGPEGTPLRHGRRGSLAEQWAETFTGKYPQLAEAWPVFHQLRNCMDLAVVAALFVKEELPRRTQCDLTFLLDPDTIQLASYPVPKRVASQASLFRAGGTWLVAVSGGVAVDSWSVLQTTQVQPELVARRRAASTAPAAGWWWD
jgi:hypothetical protein